jgi:hypothetical protein
MLPNANNGQIGANSTSSIAARGLLAGFQKTSCPLIVSRIRISQNGVAIVSPF